MLNSRCIKILEMLSRENNTYSVDYIANKFNVSNRMIRYDIDSINNYLRKHNINEIEKKPNSPIKLKITKKEKESIENLTKNLSMQTYVLSNNERCGILLYELLSLNNECTYSYLQEKLLVSKSTIVSDLKKAKEWLKQYDISIVKSSNKGILIEGIEVNIRKAMVDLLIANNEYNIMITLEKLYTKENSDTIKNFRKIQLSSSNIEYIKGLVSELESSFGTFSDSDFMNIVIHIYIIVNRNIDKRFINDKIYKSIEVEYTKEHIEVCKLIEKLNNKFSLNIDKQEISYLSSIILSSSKNNKNIFESKDYLEASSLANSIILQIRKQYIKDFSMDSKLYKSFINHINNLIFRIRFNILTYNPVCNLIMKNYKEDFLISRDISQIFEEKFNWKANDDELSYITMYIYTAKESMKTRLKEDKKNIIIACNSGFATARLLEYRINNVFDVNIVAITSIHDINTYKDYENIDYIISTTDINNCYFAPVITVPAIFNESDIDNLKQVLNYKVNKEKIYTISDLIKIIESSCTIENRDKLISDIEKYLKTGSRSFKSLKHCISKSNIQLNIDANNWEDGVKISAKPLIDEKIIEEGYVDAIIDNINKLGSYIVVDDMIAMPHARPGNYVNDFGISITTFKNPIKIGSYNDIKIFITISSPDGDSHIDFITQIMMLIDNEEFINLLENASSNDDILDYINYI